ncbi:deoxyribodipyrimidine photo-lyase [Pokkaliibacter plantistimulans]|uniref:Deoxyribodipyrimidine photo-lyase n=1 Tax=Proteobacteria bacterium 228 TaxID=2083153 RepID=A0A2S5KN53_9PROT|nr:deoxyribodipyrimidine photo-lyase [Pokkaliibacter plantistimulans]PPC76093.1 deoxyribodipyrimidine photo-lyase [Pokkaliibacter plantistimulans]
MQLVWFRNDLRTLDNTALYYACKRGQPVTAVVAITPEQWQSHGDAPVKQSLYYRSLLTLKSSLAQLNIPLKVIETANFTGLPQQILDLSLQLGCTAIHVNRHYEWNERQCEEELARLAVQAGIEIQRYTDQVFHEPGSVLTGKSEYYTVFTPFKKNIWPTLTQHPPQSYPVPPACPASAVTADDIPCWLEDDEAGLRADLWPAGEEEAIRRLELFVERKLPMYGQLRDIPSQPGTSTLSPYLALGIISPRTCLHYALSRLPEARAHQGAETWINELIWRDFYKHILVGFPRVSKHRAFKQDTEALAWRYSDCDLQRWQQGQTGYPLVDAAMRQLNQTGWMHNRLRMVTAMFLSKHLLLDWRLGEAYFMSKLVDGDLAANNGGWQWSASTGTDAAPYFRIFNPVSQSEKFDPEGRFIRRFVPELAHLDNKTIHSPWLAGKVANYPAPIVDHKFARQRVLDSFQALKEISA